VTGQDRLAVVTASASGIGLVTAKTLAREGWRLVLSDVDEDKGRHEARQLNAEFRPCDVRDADQIAALFDGLDPHVLVNNAGIAGPTAPVPDVSVEEWRDVMNVNINSQFIACRLVVPKMIAAGEGVIINMSSVAGRIGYENRSPYAASKWAVIGFTKALAREVGEQGIRVNAILPGAVRGPRIQEVIERYAAAKGITVERAEASYLKRQATGKFVEPQEVADTIAFLCGDSARSITGEAIDVSGAFQ
jgi:NAD(P)-dependent dehydrogenase (short-subunit alcohol dehydrogenase family)